MWRPSRVGGGGGGEGLSRPRLPSRDMSLCERRSARSTRSSRPLQLSLLARPSRLERAEASALGGDGWVTASGSPLGGGGGGGPVGALAAATCPRSWSGVATPICTLSRSPLRLAHASNCAFITAYSGKGRYFTLPVEWGRFIEISYAHMGRKDTQTIRYIHTPPSALCGMPLTVSSRSPWRGAKYELAKASLALRRCRESSLRRPCIKSDSAGSRGAPLCPSAARTFVVGSKLASMKRQDGASDE